MHHRQLTTLAKCICGLFFAATFLPACGTIKRNTGYHKQPVHNRNRAAMDTFLNGSHQGRALVEKYADYLKVAPESLVNIRLYAFIDRWINTPYKWGGTDERGVDCSGFLQRLFSDVYDLKLPRTSVELFSSEQVEALQSNTSLSEGDIIFFRTLANTKVSHVGVYLQNNMFISSTTSKGVIISSLENSYWKRCYVSAGRIRNWGFGNRNKELGIRD